jgi:MFS family permease
MVDAWGYSGMSNVATLLGAITPAAALFLIDEGKEDSPARIRGWGGEKLTRVAHWAGAAFVLFILAEIMGNSASGPGNLGRSLSMNDNSFSNASITTTMAVGGLISLPFPFLLGRLSDVVGRRSIMIASFLAGTAGLLLLIVARPLWQFWAVAGLLAINGISTTVGPAYVADIVRKERVGTGISVFQSSTWVATIVGLIYAGSAFQRLGMRVGLALGAVLPLVGIFFLLLVRTSARPRGQ